ncbi:hypothetical protein BDN72DRAFT_903107 [Pluteus cervinus]|uniref:Uncharacterized protein n=1 Tax=Pluteus cervinus TaxID=181527 RepID=A0ACD3ACK7_9AGAR|nr:hypothetical protein BDN72DRAFT_903107 [Pluteus cervinus]
MAPKRPATDESVNSIKKRCKVIYTNLPPPVPGSKHEKRWCEICRKYFSCAGDRNRHIKDVHTAHGAPRPECTVCKATYSRKFSLDRHVRRTRSCRRALGLPDPEFSATGVVQTQVSDVNQTPTSAGAGPSIQTATRAPLRSPSPFEFVNAPFSPLPPPSLNFRSNTPTPPQPQQKEVDDMRDYFDLRDLSVDPLFEFVRYPTYQTELDITAESSVAAWESTSTSSLPKDFEQATMQEGEYWFWSTRDWPEAPDPLGFVCGQA